MNKILIISNENNQEVNGILPYLENKEVFFLNLSKIHSHYSISLFHNDCYFEIINEKTKAKITSTNTKTIWYVTENDVYKEGFEKNDELAYFFRNEFSMLLNGIVSCAEELNIKIINPPHKVFFAGDKTRQMLTAKKVGFQLPHQLITNRITSFVDQNWSTNCIAKPIHSSNFIHKMDKTLFSNPVNITKSIYQAILKEEVELTVHHFQEKLNFIHEYRVVCFNNQVFPFKISGNYILDWREHMDSITIEFDPAFSLINECNEYMDSLDIKLGAFDFIQTEKGIFFIECNSPGHIQFCDPDNNTGMLKAFADYLSSDFRY